jgi:hypothetical protein
LHSIGAKLAALIFAAGLPPVAKTVQTAQLQQHILQAKQHQEAIAPKLSLVLIDPVDSGGGSGGKGPSAVEALAGKEGSAAVIGGLHREF